MRIKTALDFLKKADSVINTPVYEVVKPKVGSVVKVALTGGLMDHSGIYIGRPILGLFGKERIVELTNLDGKAVVRKVSIDEFFKGSPDGIVSRTGEYIYVACKQDRKGKCIAMGSRDIARRAKAAVGHVSKYNLVLNNCHAFTEYCITGLNSRIPGTLMSIEKVLNVKFAQESYERLQDMWRSTGISR